MRKSFVWLALAVASLGTVATAAPLNLVLLPTPDIASAGITVTYNAGTQAFSAQGSSQYVNDPFTLLFGSFDLQASIDNSGNLLSGSLNITDFAATSVLTGSALQFGFSALEPFEFVFKITGGTLAALFGGTGGTVGVIINQTGIGATDFANSFAGTGSGVADTAPTPEPASWLMLVSAAGFLAARRARRS
ncbi:MAG: PEP-CTERM sorting domain-containing protein [Acidobacteria bacterium]|nr:PEP-CTERM sorting domain-containing protein [Acidobacteriota bacterium]